MQHLYARVPRLRAGATPSTVYCLPMSCMYAFPHPLTLSPSLTHARSLIHMHSRTDYAHTLRRAACAVTLYMSPPWLQTSQSMNVCPDSSPGAVASLRESIDRTSGQAGVGPARPAPLLPLSALHAMSCESAWKSLYLTRGALSTLERCALPQMHAGGCPGQDRSRLASWGVGDDRPGSEI